MERLEEQTTQMSAMQMSSSAFSSSTSSAMLRKVSQGLSRSAEGRSNPARSSSPHLPRSLTESFFIRRHEQKNPPTAYHNNEHK